MNKFIFLGCLVALTGCGGGETETPTTVRAAASLREPVVAPMPVDAPPTVGCNSDVLTAC